MPAALGWHPKSHMEMVLVHPNIKTGIWNYRAIKRPLEFKSAMCWATISPPTWRLPSIYCSLQILQRTTQAILDGALCVWGLDRCSPLFKCILISTGLFLLLLSSRPPPPQNVEICLRSLRFAVPAGTNKPQARCLRLQVHLRCALLCDAGRVAVLASNHSASTISALRGISPACCRPPLSDISAVDDKEKYKNGLSLLLPEKQKKGRGGEEFTGSWLTPQSWLKGLKDPLV